jgi:hypothetical protein
MAVEVSSWAHRRPPRLLQQPRQIRRYEIGQIANTNPSLDEHSPPCCRCFPLARRRTPARSSSGFDYAFRSGNFNQTCGACRFDSARGADHSRGSRNWWTANTQHGRISPRDAARADQNFIAGLKSLSQSDILSARQHLTQDYFVHNLNEQQQQRKAISDVFDPILQEMRKMQ